MPDERVIGDEGAGVSNPEMASPEGGAPQEGVAPSTPDDAQDLQAQLEAAQERISKYESDMSKLRSVEQQRRALEVGEANQRAREYEERMHQAAMAGMDEAERIAYERDVALQRAQRAQMEAEQLRANQEAVLSMNQYAQSFVQMGVPFDRLDFTSPEALYASGWEGVARRQDELQKRIAELESKPSAQADPEPAQSSGVKAPPVMAQHGAQPSGTKTMGDVIQSLKNQYPDVNWTEDTVLTYVERGQLPITILDGIDWDKSPF